MKIESSALIRRSLAVLMLSAGLIPGFASDAPPAVDQADWRVGVALLETENGADAATLSAASLIPRLVRDALEDLDVHELTSGETRNLAARRLEEEIRAARRSLGNLYDARDRLFFDPNAAASALRDREDEIADRMMELYNLENFRPADVTVPASMSLVFAEGEPGREFLNPVRINPKLFLKYNSLDALIHGNTVRVGDYFGIRLMYSTRTADHVLWEGAVGEDRLQESANEAAAEARSLLLGRDWAGMTISTIPSGATISLDGEVVGVGLWSSGILRPGEVTVAVEAPGFTPEARVVELSDNGMTSLDFRLEAAEVPSVLVRSDPTGADVRLGSLWLGRTPLAIELPDRVMSLTFDKDGFRQETIPFYPDSEPLVVPMTADLVDPAVEFAASRRKLHHSITWFSLSLAPTIILLGVSQNYANLFLNATTPEEQQFAFDAYNLTNGLMWASVGVNALLLTNVLIKLSRYLKAAEVLNQ